MVIKLKDGDISNISEEEKQGYIDYVKQKYPDEIIDEIIISFDDEGYAKLEIHKHSKPFIRIRRITGYLVGSLERFNDAKYEEVKDRVPHDLIKE